MIFGSTAKNVNLLSLSACIFALLGLFLPINFTIGNLLISVICFYILNILGVWITLHRYYSHNSFEFKSKYLKYFFTVLALLAGRGSVLSWVYIHKQHHRYSDGDKDPHSPSRLGYKIFGFGHYNDMEKSKTNLFLIKEIVNPTQLFIHKYYILVLLAMISPLFLNLELLYFSYILPITLVHLSQNNFNYFGHTHGYRNFETKDNSKNNIWLFPLILGEAWHNNHHANTKAVTTKIKKFEFDPASSIIKTVGYTG